MLFAVEMISSAGQTCWMESSGVSYLGPVSAVPTSVVSPIDSCLFWCSCSLLSPLSFLSVVSPSCVSLSPVLLSSSSTLFGSSVMTVGKHKQVCKSISFQLCQINEFQDTHMCLHSNEFHYTVTKCNTNQLKIVKCTSLVDITVRVVICQ